MEQRCSRSSSNLRDQSTRSSWCRMPCDMLCLLETHRYSVVWCQSISRQMWSVNWGSSVEIARRVETKVTSKIACYRCGGSDAFWGFSSTKPSGLKHHNPALPFDLYHNRVFTREYLGTVEGLPPTCCLLYRYFVLLDQFENMNNTTFQAATCRRSIHWCVVFLLLHHFFLCSGIGRSVFPKDK